MKQLRRAVFISMLAAGFILSPVAHASPEREFIMSCTYGVLAGTLVGAASLAFTDNPGDNLQRVARGASIGLYVGIGLGIYTAYVLPKQLEKEENKMLEGDSEDEYQSRIPPVIVVPFVAENGGAGLFASYQMASF